MRISVRKEDRGYKADAYMYDVYLDEKRITHCFTADEVLGEAHVLVCNENGNPLLAEDGKELKTQTLHGVVEIKRNKNSVI